MPESPLIHDGTLILGFDARNSTLTGTTLGGPSGSGQFLPVTLGTTNFTVIAPTSGGRIYGVLQNKGSTGQVADVAIFGVCKAICVSSFAAGALLGVSTLGFASGSSLAVGFGPYSSAAGIYAVGIARESATPGAVFSMLLYGGGAGSGGL
jgi:hypothetical protein